MKKMRLLSRGQTLALSYYYNLRFVIFYQINGRLKIFQFQPRQPQLTICEDIPQKQGYTTKARLCKRHLPAYDVELQNLK